MYLPAPPPRVGFRQRETDRAECLNRFNANETFLHCFVLDAVCLRYLFPQALLNDRFVVGGKEKFNFTTKWVQSAII